MGEAECWERALFAAANEAHELFAQRSAWALGGAHWPAGASARAVPCRAPHWPPTRGKQIDEQSLLLLLAVVTTFDG